MDFMQNQVAERKAEIRTGITEGKKDIFTMLVKANEAEAGKFQLDDEELVSSVSAYPKFTYGFTKIGNVFIMLFAGHGQFLSRRDNYGSKLTPGQKQLLILWLLRWAFSLCTTTFKRRSFNRLPPLSDHEIRYVVTGVEILLIRKRSVKVFDDYAKLDKVLSAFYEALRLFRTYL